MERVACSVEVSVDPMPSDETTGSDEDEWALNVRLSISDARAFNSSSMSVDGKIYTNDMSFSSPSSSPLDEFTSISSEFFTLESFAADSCVVCSSSVNKGRDGDEGDEREGGERPCNHQRSASMDCRCSLSRA